MENVESVEEPKTADGRNWLKAYLHPPSGSSSVAGIPDTSVQSSTTINFRNEFSIDAPSGATDTWSALVVALPCPQYPILVLKWRGDLPTLATDIQRTFYPNPNFDFGINGALWENTVARFRYYSSSTTVYFDGASLYDQGKCYVSQGAFSSYPLVGSSTQRSPSAVYDLAFYPVTGSVIMQMSDKYFTGLAKEGSYSPEGFINPSIQYETGAAFNWKVEGDFPLSTQAYVQLSLTPFANIQTYGVPISTQESLSFHLYKGLLPQVTLQVKRVFGLEIIPNPGSSWAPFATPGACPDYAALEAAAVQRYLGSDGYPSASNDFGAFAGIAKALSPLLKIAWGAAKPLVKGALKAVPGGKMAQLAIKGIESLALMDTSKKQRGPRTMPGSDPSTWQPHNTGPIPMPWYPPPPQHYQPPPPQRPGPLGGKARRRNRKAKRKNNQHSGLPEIGWR